MTYEINPDNFNPSLEVAACFLEYKTQFVILLRDNNPYRNTWCLPGGKVEHGEQLLEGVVREVKQETGCIRPIESISSVCSVNVRYPNVDFVYHTFRSVLSEPVKITLNHEHKDFRWVTAEGALKKELTPGLREVIELFYKPVKNKDY